MRKFILDTNVLISAVCFSGAEFACYDYILKNYSIVLTPDTYAELSEVIKREKFRKYISSEEADEFCTLLTKTATWFIPQGKLILCRDPKDDKFLDAAQASCASAIITGDEDLLILKMIGTTPIMTVKEFLELENV